MTADEKLLKALQRARFAQSILAEVKSLVGEVIAEKTHEDIAKATDPNFDNEDEVVKICNVYNSIEDIAGILDKTSLAVADLISAKLMAYMDGK